MRGLKLTQKPHNPPVVLHEGGKPIARVSVVKENDSKLTVRVEALEHIEIDRGVLFANKHPDVNVDAALGVVEVVS